MCRSCRQGTIRYIALYNQIRIYRKLSKILKSINIVRISSEVISSACPDGFFIELQATVEVSLGKNCPGN